MTKRDDPADRCNHCHEPVAEHEQEDHACGLGPAPAWRFGRCASCRRETSVGSASAVCAECSRAELRRYFASAEARERAARILGPRLADAAASAFADVVETIETGRAA